MTHIETLEGQEKEKRQENICSMIGWPPMMFGVVTKSHVYHFVFWHNFIGFMKKSTFITLHHAAETNVLTPAGCISIFEKICSALGVWCESAHGTLFSEPPCMRVEAYKPEDGGSEKSVGELTRTKLLPYAACI